MQPTPGHQHNALQDGNGQEAAAPYADVAVDARTSKPGDIFTYAAPPHLRLRPGHLVRIPFGRRTIHGMVLRLTGELRVDYSKPVLGLVYPEPLLDSVRMELAQWVSRYYMAPLFDAMAPMLPPGFRARGGSLVQLTRNAAEPESLQPGALRLLAYLRQHPRPLRLATLSGILGPWVPNAARALLEAGVLEEVGEEVKIPAPPRPKQVMRPAMPIGEML
ncbi:MAG: hypothetical protein WD533_03845, partial [Dehalococcoidia bacterium]